VFRDRLVDDADRLWFNKKLQEQLKEHVNIQMEP